VKTLEDKINIDNLSLNFHKSNLKSSATLEKTSLKGPILLEANLLWDSIKRVFGLKNDGSGFINTKGTINIDGKKDFFEMLNLDLKLQGEFFLETLMELLKVTEPLKGYMYLDGSVKGRLNDLEGIGKGNLKRGNIFDVAVDNLNCDIYYKDGAMRFTKGIADLYKGKADVNVMIALPVVNYFEVDVRVKEISSKGLFQLIKWDPGIAEGKMSGSLLSKGKVFNPSGQLQYRNSKSGTDILSSIRSIDLNYSIVDEVISLSDINVTSQRSFIRGSGIVDLKRNNLNIVATGKTDEVMELSEPYFTALTGIAGLEFTVQGAIDNPVVDLQFESSKGAFDTMQLGYKDILHNHKIQINSSKGSLKYRKDLLLVRSVDLDTDFGIFKISGDIAFPKAKRLFELFSPIHNLSFNIEHGNLEKISNIFVDSPPMKGVLSTKFSLLGNPSDLQSKGYFKVANYGIYGYETGGVLTSNISYSKKLFVFDNTNLKGSKNEIKGNGSISLDKIFSVSLRADNFSLSPFAGKSTLLRDTSLKNIHIQGEGTFDNPILDLKANVNFRSQQKAYTVKGDINASLNGDKLSLSSTLFDNKINIIAEASTKGQMPWTFKADLKTTRYDFFIASILKDIPDDLVLNLNGNISLWGDKDTINGSLRFDKTYLNIYGNGFSNKGDIVVNIDRNNILLKNLIFHNDNSEFKASGSFILGKRYDLLFEGYSALAPLKALSSNVDSLKGDSSFVLSIAGDWNEPKINGGVEITNGTLGLKNIYYTLTSLSAYAFFDENKIIISRANGKIAGGDVTLKGNINLNKFNINKFLIEMHLNNATIAPSSDFWLNVNGDLYLRGDTNNQQIIGDVKVNRGKYTERIDWKTWLISASKIEKTKVESSKLDKISLNVKLSGGNIFIDNNISRTNIAVDLLLRGTLNNIIPIGKVESKEGLVFFRNNEFRIVKANLDFANTEKPKPYFNIVADTRVQNYNIRLTLEGFTDHFNLSLSSDPYLVETDILALLTVGQTGKQLKGMEAGIGAGEAASFLTGKIQDVLEERAKTITGFDRIQIDPTISKTTSTVSPRLTLAKKLMGEKLFVTYSASITTGEEQVWKLEYIIDRQISIIGVRDERGGLGADVKFRFEFK
ncbi:MAG: translocation/assembly module TamB, partial [Thermodesulfovibrionales bacterium]|nr:translocation/assembly module TamB [Thermodesulfovibrionales bacterium]